MRKEKSQKKDKVETKKLIPNDVFFASVEQLVGEGHSVEITIKGFSMRPFLRNGRDVVVLSPMTGVALREGMVVLFRYKGKHILHRLCRIEGERLTMEGDGNYLLQEEVGAEDVVAYVSQVKLAGGCNFGYNSPLWRRRTMLSLARKRLRTLAIDIKRKIIG